MKPIYMVIGAVIIAVAGVAGGFFVGMTYAQTQTRNTVSNFARARGAQNFQSEQSAQNGTAGTGAQASANDPCGFGRAFQFQGQSRQNGTANGQNGSQAAPGAQGGQFGQNNGGARGQGRNFGGGTFFGGSQLGNCVARGEIKSVNGDTVEIANGDQTVTVKVSDKTIISKTDRGTVADLKTGDRVTVFSTETGDTPTASGIQLQPETAATGQQ